IVNLRHLVLHNDIQLTTGRELAPTVASVEKLAIIRLSHDQTRTLLHYLNPNCTHLGLSSELPFESSHLRQSLRVNPRLFEQLTHVRISLSGIEALHLLCEHALMLRYLFVIFFDRVRMR